MKMLKSMLVTVSLALFSFGFLTPSHAQVVMPSTQNTSIHQNVFGLGAFGGASGGFGLSFRHHLPTALSYQITGAIIKVNGRLSSDIGVEVQYDLSRGGNTRFFVAGGLAYFYSGRSDNDMNAPTRAGLGLGGEWFMTGGLHAVAEGMFTFFSDGTILPLPQVGIYYYFN